MKAKVLHVVDGCNFGGIEVLSKNLIEGLSQHCTSEFLVCNNKKIGMLNAFEDLRDRGVLSKIYQLKSSGFVGLFFSIFEIIDKSRPEAIIIYPCKKPFVAVAFAAQLLGVAKILVHLGTRAPSSIIPRLKWLLLMHLFRLVGAELVPCSDAIKKSLTTPLFPLQFAATINNGCDVNLIRKVSRLTKASKSSLSSKIVIMVARLDSSKNHKLLIRAFSGAHKSDNWQLKIVGDGPMRSELEEFAYKNGLNPEEVFLGSCDNVIELLAKAEIFAFSTTEIEGFGIALVEAMASGLPILASDVPACREVLRDGLAGLLIKPRDVQAWTNALTMLMCSSSERESLSKASHSFADNYSLDVMSDKWLSLIITGDHNARK